jgi:hypothetical protein
MNLPTGNYTRRGRITTALLIGGAAICAAIAAALVWVVAPLSSTDPAFPQSAELAPVGLGVASAVSGLVLLAGVLVNWFAPRRALGRAVVLVGGVMVGMSGALLTNETLEVGWPGLAAGVGLTGGALQLAIGLLAWVASVSEWLPGPSLVKHMWSPVSLPSHTFGRTAMLRLTLAVALGWLLCALAVVTRVDVDRTGMLAWFVAVWGMPILAGMVVAGWRETEQNRLQSLGLAALAGMALDLLYLLVLGIWYYRFNAVGFAPWWAIMGAIFGATGFTLWHLLVRRGHPLHPRARSS